MYENYSSAAVHQSSESNYLATVLSTWHVLTHFTFTTTLQGSDYGCTHFTGEKTEPQSHSVTVLVNSRVRIDLRSHWEEGSAGLCIHSWGPQNSHPSGRCVLLIPEPHVDDQLCQVFGPLVTSYLPWDLRVAQGRSPQTHLTSRKESTGWH